MPAQVTGFFRRLGEIVHGFSIAQRTIALIGVAAVVLGAVALGTWLTRPTYTPLFSGLSASDASAVVDQLDSDSVSYQLTDGGATILVPQANVYDERLKAASNGLPSSNAGGYALLDKMGVTSSEFQQDVTYKRALEGELASTIGAMKGVKAASVKLAIPKDTVFVSQQEDPTASVFVQTQSGVTLSTDQVDAIVHLTSASIEGMKPTDVSVVAADGTVLSAVGTGTRGSASKVAGAYEESTRASIQAMLDRIVGPGNSTVAVSAKVSDDSAKRVTETYTNPKDVPSLKESTKTETYTGSGGSASGVLGPDNIAGPTGGGDGQYTSDESVKNNAVNKVTETRSIPAGAIDRQTVSVAINDEAAGSVNPVELTALVQSAAGYDQARGDVVTVQTVAFNKDAATAAQKALADSARQAEADRTADLIRTGVIVGGVSAVAIVALILLLRRRRAREERELDELEELTEAEVTEMLSLPTPPPPPAAPEALPAAGDPSPDRPRGHREEILALAANDPEKTAALLRGLMEEKV